MLRLAEMALKVESKRDQIQKFREQIQSIQNRDDDSGEEEKEEAEVVVEDEEPEGDIVYEVQSREDIDNAVEKKADVDLTNIYYTNLGIIQCH